MPWTLLETSSMLMRYLHSRRMGAAIFTPYSLRRTSYACQLSPTLIEHFPCLLRAYMTPFSVLGLGRQIDMIPLVARLLQRPQVLYEHPLATETLQRTPSQTLAVKSMAIFLPGRLL